MKKLGIKQIAIIGMLVALDIVLARFLSINSWNMKIGFEFVPVVVAAILFGWLPAGIVAALGDFIGAICFPTGAYFPGLTLSAFVVGTVFGLLLYKEQSILKIIISVSIVQFIIGLIVNSLWISIISGTDYLPTLISRIPQCVLLFAIEIVVIKIMSIYIVKIKDTLTQ